MDRIRVDLRQLDRLDIQKLAVPVRRSPPGKKLPGEAKGALASALDLGQRFDPRLKVLHEVATVSERPPAMVIQPPTTVPVGLHGGASIFTLASGVEASMFMFMGATVGMGLYGSNNGELGYYGTGGPGLWTNMGIGVGISVTYIFGPPADLAGVALGIGADAGVNIVSGSVMLLFSFGPPFRFIGLAFGLGVGVSELPVDITVQVTETKIRPLVTFA